MNKYQEEFYKQIEIKPVETENKLESFNIENEVITIKQNKNYNIIKYDFVINGIALGSIEKIEGLNGRTWKEIGKTKFQLDFSNKYTKIKIHFLLNVVDPIILDVVMKDADKEAYDLEIEKQRKEELEKYVSLQLASGVNCINVYFNRLNGHAYSLIKLYRIDGVYTRCIGTFSIDGNNYFPITNLASGQYKVSIEQYDFDKKIIYKSEDGKSVFVNQVPQPPIRH